MIKGVAVSYTCHPHPSSAILCHGGDGRAAHSELQHHKGYLHVYIQSVVKIEYFFTIKQGWWQQLPVLKKTIKILFSHSLLYQTEPHLSLSRITGIIKELLSLMIPGSDNTADE